ncbi:RDD family protein [Bacillaceae bacterium Marseille-Q3522]|nr:RDD family protein [Bacillaceae bacterium Marseille-Q3522]
MAELEKQNNGVTADPSVTMTAASYRFAGFWMRLWAFLFDLIVIASINRIIIYPVFRLLDFSLDKSSMFAPISILTAITFYAYFVLMTKLCGQTLGKMVFGLKVVNLKGKTLTWSTILFREWIGRFISTKILFSYLIIAFLPKKQGLHDLFTDTTVIHEKP